MAPVSLASSSNTTATGATAIPHFEKRSGPVPELRGIKGVVDRMNLDNRPHPQVIRELHAAKTHFTMLRDRGLQTQKAHGEATNRFLTPILNSENARNPGLNAAGCKDEQTMVKILGFLAKHNPGREGHIRFNLGINDDTHRIAVDAFKHREGGFTLISVEPMQNHLYAYDIANLRKQNPDIIKGTMHLPTDNQVHIEGCRIFAVHTLNAFHDFEPHIQNLHRQIYDAARGRPAPYLADPLWEKLDGTHIPKQGTGAFAVLPGKFFKHMQVMKPYPGETQTILDYAEEMNLALKDQPVNKKGQTLRQRYESRNPSKRHEEFSRAERTSSLDNKRLVLIDRAIAYYEGLAQESKPLKRLRTDEGLAQEAQPLKKPRADEGPSAAPSKDLGGQQGG